MTETISDRDPWKLRFATEVLSLMERTADDEACFAAILDRTAFFPKQGGQKADRDTLDGTKILDVMIWGDIIIHLIDAPLSVSSMVTRAVSWVRRFDLMQQHTGEHISSGSAHRLFDVENVGFHLNKHEVQVDLSVPLGAANLARLGSTVNGVVFRDIPVRAFHPDTVEPAAISYRQKKELTRAIRLVETGDVDTCACYAPHAMRNPEVEPVKTLSAMNYKGGTRLHLTYGVRAPAVFSAYLGKAKEISAQFSIPLGELDSVVVKVQEGDTAVESRAAPFVVELILTRTEITVQRGERAPCPVLPPLLESMLQRTLKPPRECFSGVFGLFSGTEGTGYAFLPSGDGVDRKSFFAEVRSHGGKGGGGRDRIQSRTFCKATEILTLFYDFIKSKK